MRVISSQVSSLSISIPRWYEICFATVYLGVSDVRFFCPRKNRIGQAEVVITDEILSSGITDFKQEVWDTCYVYLLICSGNECTRF